MRKFDYYVRMGGNYSVGRMFSDYRFSFIIVTKLCKYSSRVF